MLQFYISYSCNNITILLHLNIVNKNDRNFLKLLLSVGIGQSLFTKEKYNKYNL